MKHYNISEWADFARGLLKGAVHMAMAAHLERGCRKCKGAAKLMRNLTSVASAEPQYQAPSSVVHQAKAIYALRRPEKLRLLPRLAARLIFDSFRSPQLAGVRSRQVVSRQALYHAGNFSLDLRLDREPGSSEVVLVGQIANHKQPAAPLPPAPVFLLHRKEIVGQTLSNRWGEFQMECPPEGRLRLCVSIQGMSKKIEISLDRLMTGERKNAKVQRSFSSARRTPK